MTSSAKKQPGSRPRKKGAPKGTSKGKASAKKKLRKEPTARKRQTAPATGSAAQRARKWALRTVYLAAGCALSFFLATVLWVGAGRYLNPPITGLMLIRHFGEGLPIDKAWRDYQDISSHLLLAVLAAEDQRFYDHHGFDLKEIRIAIEERDSTGRMRGASTLSQQTAKNVFLWPGRSWWRKGAEAYFTVLLETLWSKRRILEVYVNVAEMGPGVYGAESAARRYFDISAADLTPEQAALLASILPSPLTRDPSAPTAYMEDRQEWILGQMNNLGGVSFLR